MRLLVDMDGILVNLLPTWLDIHNRETGEAIGLREILSFEVHEFVSTGHRVYDILKRPGFFDDLPPHEGAIEAMRKLEERGHEVMIATDPAGPDSARAKLAWVERHLGWNRRRVFLCHHKDRIDADAIIDDKPETLQRFASSGRLTATIAHPYNRSIASVVDCYAEDFEDTGSAWSTILAWAERVSL